MNEGDRVIVRWTTSMLLLVISCWSASAFAQSAPSSPLLGPDQAIDERNSPTFAYGETNPLEVGRMYETKIMAEGSYFPRRDDFVIELGYDCSSTNPCTGDPILMVEYQELLPNGTFGERRQFISDDLNTDDPDLYAIERHGRVSFSTHEYTPVVQHSSPYRSYEITVRVFAFDEAYKGQTNIAIWRDGQLLQGYPLYNVPFNSRVIKTKWREGDRLTYTSHYESISLSAACNALGGTWNLGFFQCQNATISTSTTPVTLGVSQFNVLCAQAATALNRPRLRFRGVYPHGHKCEYVLPEQESPALMVFNNYTNDLTVGYSCREYTLPLWLGGGTFTRCGFFDRHAYDPTLSVNEVSRDDVADFRTIDFEDTQQGDLNALVVAMGPWNSAFSASQTTLPIRLYKEGKVSTSDTFVDSDEDGLSDRLEAQLGTVSTDPDSDNDGILDGLEVWGTYKLPLPMLGASPVQRDLVVEWDRYSTTTRREGSPRVDIINQTLFKVMEGTYNGLALEEAGFNPIFLTERFSPLDWSNPQEQSDPGTTEQVITRGINSHINHHLDDEWAAKGRVCMSGVASGAHEIDQANGVFLGSPPDTLLDSDDNPVNFTNVRVYRTLAQDWCRQQYPEQNGTAFARACYELGKVCEASDGSPRWCDDPGNAVTQSCFIQLGMPANDIHQHYPFALLVSWMTSASGSASETTRFAHMGDGALSRTLGHEIGHLLGLGHGGVDAQGRKDNRARKPNYWSTMSYGVNVALMNVGAGGATRFFNVQGRSRMNGNPGGIYLFSNTSTSYVLNENNLDETRGMNNGQPFIVRGAIFTDESLAGSPTVMRNLNLATVDWNENGVAFDVGVRKDIDSSLASRHAHLRCLWWGNDDGWARPNSSDPSIPGTSCTPSTRIDSPASDLSYLQSKDLSLSPDEYTWQRDQLEHRVAPDVRASWTSDAVPDEDVNIRRQLLTDGADPNLVVCEPWE